MPRLLAVLVAVLPCVARADDYVRDVRPILERHCVRCHGPKKQEGGLRLDVRSSVMTGGDSGPALVARAAGKSELIRRVEANDDHRMPPSGKGLEKADVAKLRAWIDRGAVWPDAVAGHDARADHWAFRPVRRPPVPVTKGAAGPVDAFILERLAARGLSFSPRAEPTTLVRRLHLDLTGLPPSPEEVEAFLADRRPDAYERLVDRLLASPAFGERWGRHWLDLTRYAESDGYENDRIRPDAWRWRDWVIAAYNADQPYDEFTVEQLAGDLLPKPTPSQRTATGLHRNTLWNSAASGDKEEFRTRAVKDRVETTGLVWLGLTFGCAQCHGHKYDPISQREYYQFYAFFNDTDDDTLVIPGGKVPTLKAVRRVSTVHKRGNFLDKGDVVRPATPAVLPPLSPRGKEADRLDLARWLVAPANPLPARVAVNHVWQTLFGEGLVRTPENFGKQGSAPTHPQLLDWLASEFASGGWSRKALIRAIVLSSAYRQSSDRTAGDPDNQLLGRQNRYRLEAEAIRDGALAASGLLDRRVGGPSIVPPFPRELPDGQFRNEAFLGPTKERLRRGVYIHVQRTLTHPSLAALDAPDGNQPCPRRDRGCTPVQALTLLDNPVFAECARALGDRVRREASGNTARLDRAFRLALGRAPSAAEIEVMLDLVRRQEALNGNEATVWAGVARVVLNLDEFLNRE